MNFSCEGYSYPLKFPLKQSAMIQTILLTYGKSLQLFFLMQFSKVMVSHTAGSRISPSMAVDKKYYKGDRSCWNVNHFNNSIFVQKLICKKYWNEDVRTHYSLCSQNEWKFTRRIFFFKQTSSLIIAVILYLTI